MFSIFVHLFFLIILKTFTSRPLTWTKEHAIIISYYNLVLLEVTMQKKCIYIFLFTSQRTYIKSIFFCSQTWYFSFGFYYIITVKFLLSLAIINVLSGTFPHNTDHNFHFIKIFFMTSFTDSSLIISVLLIHTHTHTTFFTHTLLTFCRLAVMVL